MVINTAHFCENCNKTRQNHGSLCSCQFAETRGFQLPKYIVYIRRDGHIFRQ